ncbi:MAG: M28 family peptidase [Planctomycetes bacterium]|nr:M28 family peptidase [Planctomycetota bacterium]
MRPRRFALSSLAVFVLAALLQGCASHDLPMVSPSVYEADVRWLADDAREGRETGSRGLFAAADYVAARFASLGLAPGGDDGTWFQHFTAAGPRELGDDNSLVVGDLQLEFETEWMPLSSSGGGSVQGPLVFAGFGISDPDGGWDDYQGLPVDGAVVLLLRGGPGAGLRATLDAAGEPVPEPLKRWAEGGEGHVHTSFRSKINAAFTHGAAAVIVANDPLTHPAGGENDTLLPYAPFGGGGATASMPAALLTAAAGQRVLQSLGYDLEVLQQRLDQLMKPRSFRFPSTTADVTVDAAAKQLDTVNVVGILPAADGHTDGEHVLVGAHVDHLGFGRGPGSLGGDAAVGQIHNGADDNASGTAGLLGLATSLSARRDDLARPVVFVAFSGEEWGLLGSRFYVEHPKLPVSDMVGMVNMDMIGRGVGGKVQVGGTGSWDGFAALVDSAAAQVGGLVVTQSDSAPGSSDHASFLEKDVPSLFLFTGLHADYHKPSDDADKIDAVDGAKIATLAGEVAFDLATRAERPVYSEPPAADPHAGLADADDGDRPAVVAYGVKLGSVPDMGYQGTDGVRLADVGTDSPAERAGLKAGDVVIALDGKPTKTLEDYSVLLFSHRPGDTIILTVLRGDDKLDLTATLEGRRADG